MDQIGMNNRIIEGGETAALSSVTQYAMSQEIERKIGNGVFGIKFHVPNLL